MRPTIEALGVDAPVALRHQASADSQEAHTRATRSVSCVLVGGTSLLIRCAELLRAEGHKVLAIFSSDKAVVSWARDASITVHPAAHKLDETLAGQSFDYLFSVVNYRLLGAAELALPRQAAINFHDGPLPRYAGLHATTWALLSQETRHGITWHLIDDGVDTGAIVEQVEVEVRPKDSTYSLNARCYEAAIRGFSALLARLGRPEGLGQTRAQDRKARTVYSKYDRPVAAGFLRFSESARRVDAMVRALDFGPVANPIGFARLWTGDTHLLVGKCRAQSATSSFAPGTIVQVDPHGVTVATQEGEAVLYGLRHADGSDVADVMEHFTALGLTVGMLLPAISDAEATRLKEAHQQAARGETTARTALLAAEPLTLSTRSLDTSGQVEELHVPAPAHFIEAPGLRTAAAFLVYLARLSNQSSFTLGASAVADDLRRYGLFASRVPWSFEYDPAKSWSDTLAELSARLESLPRSSYLVDLPLRDPALRECSTTRFPVFLGSRNDSLAPDELAIVIDDSGLTLRMMPEALAAHWARAIRDFPSFLALTAGDAAASGTPLLSEEQRVEQFVTWNDNAAPFPQDRAIHQLVEEQVARTPDAVAVIHGERKLSYRELDQRATRLAAILRQRGVVAETRVGVCLKRSADIVVALYAVLKAGGAYVPLDPAYPEARNAIIMEDARLPLLITHSDLASFGPVSGVERLELDRIDLTREAEAVAQAQVSPRQLAYLIYTSGSTGRPKGVAIEHRSAVALIAWSLAEFSAAELRMVLASTSVCFDMSVFEIFATLSAGGSVVMVQNFLAWAEHPSPAVSLIDTVPSAMREYLRTLKGKTPPPELLGVNLGGELLPQAVVEEICAAIPNAKLRDLYGPSEDTTFSTFALRAPGIRPSVGRPVSNTRTYVLDERLKPLPVGFAGELYIAGDGLARGYLDRPELTAQCFIDDPFCPGQRMYRTRDLCRYLDDGRIEYVRRIDNQVKFRGFRIELGEIETTLLKHADVEQCVAMVRPDEAGHPALVAYVTLKGPTTPSQLREHLASALPAHMVPRFVVLEELPLNPNGKVDKPRLPAPRVERTNLSRAFEAPRNEVETVLCAIWSELLGLPNVGIHDGFFELGGSSLIAIQVQQRVAAQLGAQVSVAEILTHPTIAGVALLVQASGGAKVAATAESAVSAAGQAQPAASARRLDAVSETLPEKVWMGPSQWSFWFGYHPDQFNVPLYLPFEGPVDLQRLSAALDALPRQFPSLRYVADRFVPVLRRAPLAPVPLTVFERRGLGTTPTQDALAFKAFMAERARDFKASGVAPQLQAFLCRMGDDRSVLALRYPHYLGDGHSNTLIADVLLRWLADGNTSLHQTVSFAEEISIEARAFSPKRVAELSDFWGRYLAQAANLRAEKHWFERGQVKERVLADVPARQVEDIRRKHGLLYRTLYGAALMHAFRKLTGTHAVFIRNFLLRRRAGGGAETIYPRLYIEALHTAAPLSASPEALLFDVRERTTALSHKEDVSLPLALSPLFSQVAGRSRTRRGGWAKGLTAATSVVARAAGANPELQHLLPLATADFLREPQQIDVFLNYIPAAASCQNEGASHALIKALDGKYRRRCDGTFREFFGLDVIEAEGRHILSLDSPFRDEIDLEIIAHIRDFLNAVAQGAS